MSIPTFPISKVDGSSEVQALNAYADIAAKLDGNNKEEVTTEVVKHTETQLNSVTGEGSTATQNRYQSVANMVSGAENVDIATEDLRDQVKVMAAPKIVGHSGTHLDKANPTDETNVTNTYREVNNILTKAENVDIATTDLRDQVKAMAAPKIMDHVGIHLDNANAENETNVTNAYRNAGSFLNTAENVDIATTDLRDQVKAMAAPKIIGHAEVQLDKANPDNETNITNTYRAVNNILTKAEDVDIATGDLRDQVKAMAEPRIVEHAGTHLDNADATDETSVTNAYRNVGDFVNTAVNVDIATDSLRANVKTMSEPKILGHAETQLNSVTGENSTATQNRYNTVNNMVTKAAEYGIATNTLRDSVKSSANPIVANHIINQVGEKISERSLSSGNRLFEKALSNDIVTEDGVQSNTGPILEPKVRNKIKESFESGKWEELKLRKIAEESKLFSPESLDILHETVMILAEGSVRASLAWGGRREAFERVETLVKMGLLRSSDADELKWTYMLKESLL